MHCRKCLLFSGNDQWVKKDGNEMFDVTMGSFDGAEVCELVGLYLRSKIANVPGIESVGLYRDNGLSCIRSTSGRILDRLRKDLSDLFKAEGLSITCETNLRITDFLDVTSTWIRESSTLIGNQIVRHFTSAQNLTILKPLKSNFLQ
jgi:hypothetical protein